jgi:glycosyltransferase involved in cell wall biosynthesis
MISVVMASFLGEYPGAASGREDKFRRAVDSFIKQEMGELVVVSDGCEITAKIIMDEYPQDNIVLVMLPKQPLFAGAVRQYGIQAATYDWICYLDSDDEFGDGHLQTITSNVDNQHDWMFYDDYVGEQRRNCLVAPCRIGTSCIVHRKTTPARWPDGYNHDWYFIQQLGQNYKKIDGAKYIVHHIPGKLDE